MGTRNRASNTLLLVALAVGGCARPAPAPGDASTSPPSGAPAPAAPPSDHASAQVAAPAETPLARLLRQLDRDGDGRVSRDEQADAASQTFRAMDADHDGQVTAAEMDAVRRDLYGASRTATAIAQVDTDLDGRISAAEHATATGQGFEETDMDHDGFLTLQDLEAAEAAARKATR
ncbi:MAG: EF-hand domain-containing protein [Luteimonas sp.]